MIVERGDCINVKVLPAKKIQVVAAQVERVFIRVPDEDDDIVLRLGGDQGIVGPRGLSVLSYIGVPPSNFGKDGEYVIDPVNNLIYGPKTNGAWGTARSLYGPAGPAATASSGVCGVNISSYTAVVLIGGLLYYADVTDPSHIDLPVFISTQAGLAGSTITYIQGGDASGGNYIQDQKYYCGFNGVLSTTFRNVGAVWGKFIGTGKTTNTLSVEMDDTYVLG